MNALTGWPARSSGRFLFPPTGCNSTKIFASRTRAQLIPYLWKLGISHCYSSPILKARAGSQHGYDIIDHNQLNPEIGTEDEFRRLATELKQRGMGLLLDTVPNHMGVGAGDNPWWQDVLQNGRASTYADFFDIDWEPLKPELCNKVLLPILGNPYGEDLESGHIQVALEDGRPVVKYFDKVSADRSADDSVDLRIGEGISTACGNRQRLWAGGVGWAHQCAGKVAAEFGNRSGRGATTAE